MLEAARAANYQEEQVQTEVLQILEPGNEFLQDLVDQFGKTRKAADKSQVACFYELKPSNIGRIVGRQDRIVCYMLYFISLTNDDIEIRGQ